MRLSTGIRSGRLRSAQEPHAITALTLYQGLRASGVEQRRIADGASVRDRRMYEEVAGVPEHPWARLVSAVWRRRERRRTDDEDRTATLLADVRRGQRALFDRSFVQSLPRPALRAGRGDLCFHERAGHPSEWHDFRSERHHMAPGSDDLERSIPDRETCQPSRVVTSHPSPPVPATRNRHARGIA